MFVVEIQHTLKKENEKMAKEKTKQTEVGVIGNSYEEKATGRVAVIEDRDSKFRTLMMRDREGVGFNITYSTLKRDWKKYSGEDVVLTADQKVEAENDKEAEKTKKVNKAKRVLKEVNEAVSVPKVDKTKAENALRDIITNTINSREDNPGFKITKNMRGGIKVYYKNHLLFGVYIRPIESKYTFDTFDAVADVLDFGDIDVEKIVHPEWRISTKFRFHESKLDDALKIMLDAVIKYTNENYVKDEKTKKEEK